MCSIAYAAVMISSEKLLARFPPFSFVAVQSALYFTIELLYLMATEGIFDIWGVDHGLMQLFSSENVWFALLIVGPFT